MAEEHKTHSELQVSRSAQIGGAIVGGVLGGPAGAALGFSAPIMFTKYVEDKKTEGVGKSLAKRVLPGLAVGIAGSALTGGPLGWANPLAYGAAAATIGATRATAGTFGFGTKISAQLQTTEHTSRPQHEVQPAKVRSHQISRSTAPSTPTKSFAEKERDKKTSAGKSGVVER